MAQNDADGVEDLLLPDLIAEAEEALDEYECVSFGMELCESFELYSPIEEGAFAKPHTLLGPNPLIERSLPIAAQTRARLDRTRCALPLR